MKPVLAVGLMTGTVLDGNIDLALLRTDGEAVQEFGAWKLAPYAADIPPLLARALAAAGEWRFDGPEPAIFREAEEALTRAQSRAVRNFLDEAGLDASRIAVIGFHGQTVLHRAPRPNVPGATRQLGDGALMARLTGIDVAYDFRSADMRAGGQGAPLSPAYHAALLRRLDPAQNTAVLNLGGVGNITWRDGEDRIIGFDTGPANAPINDWIRRHAVGAMDRDGSLARRGKVDEARLAELLSHPYFSAPFPKSLDRNDFTADMAKGLCLEDGAATLSAFSAAAVGKALDLLPERPSRLVVCGGGRRNPALVEAIASRADVTPALAEEVGWRGDAIEAECFAFLAVRVLRGLPLSFPLTTGVKNATLGGRLALARAAA
ncbi:MAG: anhydro-N-acetylmuramic acid kinase [Hyphomicrobiales bacterium]|nr:anhydro-N-acetylmuramic acid kinase [Hyphomicrobiales bacterium]